MKQQLAAWLSSSKKDYATGVKIHEALKADPNHIKFLNAKEDATRAGILLQDLQRYARINRIKYTMVKAKVIVNAAPKKPNTNPNSDTVTNSTQITQDLANLGGTERFKIIKNNTVNYDDLTPELKKAWDENMERLGEFNRLSARVREIPEGAEYNSRRKELIDEIVPLHDKIREVFDFIDGSLSGKNGGDALEIKKASGKYILAQIEAIADPVLQTECKRMRIDANQKYIRTNKDATKEATLIKLAERKAELDAWEIKYETNENTEGTK